ncbi:MAG: FAD-binding oxidoreductase [Bdellovibrionales bacterium]|nr:FAD-binding oxidoreductase [Bdellovibrionales bacterium]
MMKWWGWGHADFEFPMKSKPLMWPFLQRMVGISHDFETKPVDFSQVKMAAPQLEPRFMDALAKVLKPAQYTSDQMERLLHSYGKSYTDLVRVRRGQVDRAPDLVVLPEGHADVEQVVRLCHQFDVCLIPFGGGTNIVGCIDPMDKSRRMIVSLDMRNMNRLLSLDPVSMTATIEAGALGPKLEEDLAARGFNLGHYPDSFQHSTLGGWLATRSAGMQSDAYGKIEDMLVCVKLVTPNGTLVTREVPSSSAGPDLNRLVMGSEGTLGVITEATMRVHKSPAVKDYRGFLFKTFQDGVDATRECAQSGIPPSMIRLQDTGETELAFCLKSPKTGFTGFVQKMVKKVIVAKGFTKPCILVVGFEGDEVAIKSSRDNAFAIFKKYGAFPLGKSVGKTWYADKFNVPYLRDYIMDYGCMCDVSETSAVWAKVVPLYEEVIKSVKAQFAKESSKALGYVGCHISHTYETGACLYFTYGAMQTRGKEIEQYQNYKTLITDAIMRSGGTLSHHHAVGYEHMPWMKEEVSETGLKALRSLKQCLDPKTIMNPGKLIPEEDHVVASRSSATPERIIDSPFVG